jgi:hypothetical protein
MNEYDEQNEDLEPSEADGPVAEVTEAADDAVEADDAVGLPEIVEATAVADDIVAVAAGDEAPANATMETPVADAPGIDASTSATAAAVDTPRRRIGRLAAVAAVAALLGIAGGAGAMALLGDGGHGHGGRGDSHQMEADRHGDRHGDGHHGADGDQD